MNAVDTNVLIYAHDPRDPAKQQAADALVQSLVDGVLLWQVACEFISASRKLAPLGFGRDRAWQEMYKLHRLWTTKLPSWAVIETAQELLNAYSLSFWDATIVAACLDGGVTCLYSEDFDSYSNIEDYRSSILSKRPSSQSQSCQPALLKLLAEFVVTHVHAAVVGSPTLVLTSGIAIAFNHAGVVTIGAESCATSFDSIRPETSGTQDHYCQDKAEE